MLVITQSLWRLLFTKVRESIPRIPANSAETTGSQVNFKREVNSFLGWAISQVYGKLLNELLELDPFVDGEIHESVEKRIEFLDSMRYFDHEAALNPTYLEECYDGIFRLGNCGGLTLVSPEYFAFGRNLMQVIVGALCERDFERRGNESVREGWAHIEAHMPSLRNQFMKCAEKFTSIDDKAKEQIFKDLVEKTRNARFGVEVKARRDNKTKRGGKNHVGVSHRGAMKGTLTGSSVNKELKLEELGDNE